MYYFLNVDLFVEHIIKINASKMYYMVLNTSLHMIMYCTWTSYMYPCMSSAYNGQPRK